MNLNSIEALRKAAHKSGPNQKPMVSKRVPEGLRDILKTIDSLDALQKLAQVNPDIAIEVLLKLPSMDSWSVTRATRWMREWADYVDSPEYRAKSAQKSKANRERYRKPRAKQEADHA